jgi:RHS repeat-associated protein
VAGYQDKCVRIEWSEGLFPYSPARHAGEHWHGTLLTEKRDASGLLYRRNRYYDPATGRFTQEDPIGLAGGVNLYGFANGAPVSYSDPYGLCSVLTNSATGETQAGPTTCKLAPLVVSAAAPNRLVAAIRWLWRELNTDLCPECNKGVADFGLVGGVGPIRALGGAANIANGPRLRSALMWDEAAVFTGSGQLHGSVIANSAEIIRGSQLHSSAVIAELTRDGSNIADWGKYTTNSFSSPAGKFQVHFYRNRVTGQVNYNIDYKVKFNSQ